MTQPIEHLGPDSTPNMGPTFPEVVAEFDNADLMVCMRYSRYLERPSPKRMNEISASVSDLFDSFGEVLMSVKNDASGVIDDEARAGTLATLIHGMTIKHTEVLGDYSDALVPGTDEDRKNAYDNLREYIEAHADDMAELVDAALDHFRGALDSDMEVIEQYALAKAHSPREVIKQRAMQASLDAAKIGAGVIAGLFVYDRIKRG